MLLSCLEDISFNQGKKKKMWEGYVKEGEHLGTKDFKSMGFKTSEVFPSNDNDNLGRGSTTSSRVCHSF